MKKIKIFIILVLIIVLSGCVSKNQPENIQQNISIEENITVEQYSDWQFYRNEKLGFEIKYPKSVQNSICKLENNNLYSLESGLIPIKIFENGNIVYIGPEYFMEKKGTTIIGLDYYYSECEQVDNSIEFLNDRNLDMWQGSWKIIIKDDIYTDQDINKFLKNFYSNFGNNCVLGEKQPTSQEGVYDVFTYYDDKDLDGADCFINGRTVVKYYPERHKIAAWLIGQEWVFWGDTRNNIFYDEEMIESFRFID